jgi:hypothetical protein
MDMKLRRWHLKKTNSGDAGVGITADSLIGPLPAAGRGARALTTPDYGDNGGDLSRCSRHAGGGFGVGPAADGGGRSWWFSYLPWVLFVPSNSSPHFLTLNADSCSTIYFSSVR